MEQIKQDKNYIDQIKGYVNQMHSRITDIKLQAEMNRLKHQGLEKSKLEG